MGKIYSEDFKIKAIEGYINSPNAKKYLDDNNIPHSSIFHWLKKYNIKTPRFNQLYEIHDNYATIRLRRSDNFEYCKIDIEDIDQCKNMGIWTYLPNGYVYNCKNKIYLHRFLLNCDENHEVDHINHDTLDNRKSNLRVATSSQQKMNTKIRNDNSSGHRGVYYDKTRDTWNVNINIQNNHFRKRFKNKKDAFNFADDIYNKYFGEFKYILTVD